MSGDPAIPDFDNLKDGDYNMPEYLSPGVYMEEFEIGARPIEGVSTSTAGFLGETERGPTTPRLVTSWLQFQRVYGGYFGTDKYLPGAVEGFFNNGGNRCYIARIVKNIGVAANPAHLDLKIDKDHFLKVDAVGEGEWGNRVALKFSSNMDGDKLIVLYWKSAPSINDNYMIDTNIGTILKDFPPSVLETFNISLDEKSPDYFEKTINGISNLIIISPPKTTDKAPTELASFLTKGTDGGSEAKKASLTLRSIDELDSSLTDYANKIMTVEAKEEGKGGNKISLKFSKDKKLTVDSGDGSPEVYDITPTLKDEVKSKSQKITIDILPDDHMAAPPEGSKVPLQGGDDDNQSKIMLKSIDKLDSTLAEYENKTIKVTAVKKGADQNGISIVLTKGSGGSGKIKLEVDLPDGETVIYDNMSMDDLQIEGKSSPHVIISIDNDYRKATPDDNDIHLEGGTDSDPQLLAGDFGGKSTAGEKTGLNAFEEIEDISIIYSPSAYDVSGLVGKLIDHCENLRYRFAILDAPNTPEYSTFYPGSNNPDGSRPTDHAAFYCPWIKVINPDTGLLQSMPPGGYIAGIYSRSDTERGVHKAPANEIVKGASDLQFQIMKGEQDVLNPRGVNVIRAFSGRGILVWGARTLSSNTLWKYINVRRLFIYIEASIEKGTQWVVFEPNDERLWGRVKATITQFLTGVWRNGALMGTTPEEAFFVKCDRSTMTQDDIDNGRLICIIGIAPVKPAEFVIFRIAQWQGGSASTE